MNEREWNPAVPSDSNAMEKTLNEATVEAMIESIVTAIVSRVNALLAARANACYRLPASKLSTPLALSVIAAHQQIVVEQVGLGLLCDLAQMRCDNPAVRQLLTLIDLGEQVTLQLPAALCRHLPVRALARWPVNWQLDSGQALALCAALLLNYQQAMDFANAGFTQSMLLLAPGCVVTALAKETLAKHQVRWAYVENPLCN